MLGCCLLSDKTREDELLLRTEHCSVLLSTESTWNDVKSINWIRWLISSRSRLTYVNFASKSTGRWNFTNLVDTSAKCRYEQKHKIADLEVKLWTHVIVPFTQVGLDVTSSALQSRKWQLIGMSQWCRSALCGNWPSIARGNGQLDTRCS